MEPIRDTQATLVDLLDRILDKGLVINADIIISVAGIPLIGVNLRAALAGMETMLKYGVMQSWDERTRAWEREHRKKKEISLLEGEEIVLKMYGSRYYSKGIYTTWRSGYFYLTNKRLILHHQDFNEITLQIPLEEIGALIMKEEEHFVKEKKKQVLYLIDKQDEVYRLSAVETNQLKDAIEQNLNAKGLYLEENPILPEFEDESIVGSLVEGEVVTHREKMWYLVSAEGIQGETWRPGYLYLTNKRLCWWYEFGRRIIFEIPVGGMIASAMEIRDLSGILKKKKVLDVAYAANGIRKVASFSGNALEEWNKILQEIISRGVSLVEDDMETCPQCGSRASVKELLEKGCSECGWVSPKLKKRLAEVAATTE